MNDLQIRLTKFAQNSIAYCRLIPRNAITLPLISQYVRASTSIGANYMEAQNAISRKDFRAKVFISKKEAQEALYWLTLLSESIDSESDNWTKLYIEATEIIKIFQAITNRLATT